MSNLIHTLKNWDQELFLALNGAHNGFWDFVMWWASDKFIWIPVYLLFLYLLWKHHGRKIWIILFFASLLVFLSDQVSVHFFKNVFQRLRPSHEPALEGMVHIVNNYRGGQYGFYSSHASNVFAVAVFVISLLPKRPVTILLIIGWALLIAYSRIYLGVHYPGDVLAGALAGSILAYFLAPMAKKAMSVY